MKSLLTSLVLLSVVGYGGAKAYLHSEVADAMDLAVLMLSPYAEVEYEGVRSTMSGELTIEHIRIKMHDYQDEIRIDRMGIDTPSFLSLLELSEFMTLRPDSVPEHFGFMVERIHLAVDADYLSEFYESDADDQDEHATDDAALCAGKYGFSPESLAALGYREQIVSFSTMVNNEGGQFALEIESSIEDMWDVRADLTLAGDLMSELAKGSAYRPKLSSLVLEYTDQSLNERVRAYCGKLGLSNDEILLAQMAAFQYYGESNGIVFDEYLLEPYLEFLSGKKTIVITAKPNQPITMSHIDLYKPADVPALLNLEAQAH